jgi:hypothetical protein
VEFGASIFFTDYSISPVALAIALEERGFDSLWAAEHSHIPVPRRTPPPGGGELPKRYYDVMDPFVYLDRSRGRHQAAQARHRDLPGHPARYHSDSSAKFGIPILASGCMVPPDPGNHVFLLCSMMSYSYAQSLS